MSGIPFVARSSSPTLDAFLFDLDQRVVRQERKYKGPARGTLSRLAVNAVVDLYANPVDDAVAFVTSTTTWYKAVAGVWTNVGPTEPA